ncbi:hypothetical protein HK102_009360, partial [Quaeritorhiza haematococci]
LLYIDTFLLTFRHFLSPSSLINMLLKKFQMRKDDRNDAATSSANNIHSHLIGRVGHTGGRFRSDDEEGEEGAGRMGTIRYGYDPDFNTGDDDNDDDDGWHGGAGAGGLGDWRNEDTVVMHRIVSLVKRWVGEHYYDFTVTETMASLSDFLDAISDTEFAGYGDQIRSIIQYEMVQNNILQSQTKSLHSHSASADGFGGGGLASLTASPTMVEELRNLIYGLDILSVSSKKLAQQLTLADSKSFRSIKSEEFANFLWDKQESRTRHLQIYIDRFNKVGYWVGTVICSYDDVRRRALALEKIIKIAKCCFECQNYNSAMALLSGLNTTPVSRLKKTFAALSSRAMATYQDLENKLSYRGNYKTYREIEHLAKPPLLPFFGLIIKDLTFLNDGNQKILQNGLINFEKQRLIFNVINSIREYQRHKFPFAVDDTPRVGSSQQVNQLSSNYRPVSLFTYCSSPPSLKEEQLMLISKILEPSEKDVASNAANTLTAGAPTTAIGAPAATSGTTGTVGASYLSPNAFSVATGGSFAPSSVMSKRNSTTLSSNTVLLDVISGNHPMIVGNGSGVRRPVYMESQRNSSVLVGASAAPVAGSASVTTTGKGTYTEGVLEGCDDVLSKGELGGEKGVSTGGGEKFSLFASSLSSSSLSDSDNNETPSSSKSSLTDGATEADSQQQRRQAQEQGEHVLLETCSSRRSEHPADDAELRSLATLEAPKLSDSLVPSTSYDQVQPEPMELPITVKLFDSNEILVTAPSLGAEGDLSVGRPLHEQSP